ncbi:DUF805 domain-containing protein [Amaricoccus sp.]|uniref:DUF805 domain-containing protein n=1 Tax=Amaricoccus sp. TaxID=1872485 RepID=UPI001B5563EF|nr:DUF805 domain-containing protein [Amaricoccus sp.]MBP7001743.1 DUF805 domain-containing protein [Amaricoccus sp.]
MSDVEQWYYVDAGQRLGPVSIDEIRRLVRDSRLSVDALVWRSGLQDWIPLHQSPAADAASSLPPPLPAAARWGGSEKAAEMAGGFPPTSGGEARPMGFAEAISSGFSQYATFAGRASRSEFWYFTLFTWLISIISSIIDASIGSSPESIGVVGLMISLVIFLPGLAVSARRLHDIDRTGWWLLMMILPIIGWIVLLVFYCTKPTPGRNRFG